MADAKRKRRWFRKTPEECARERINDLRTELARKRAMREMKRQAMSALGLLAWTVALALLSMWIWSAVCGPTYVARTQLEMVKECYGV